MKTETIESLAKGLRVLKLLAGHPVTGLSNQEMSQALGIGAPNVTRIMHTLIEEGWAIRLETGRFAPGISYLGASQRAFDAAGQLISRASEMQRRVMASAEGFKRGESND